MALARAGAKAHGEHDTAVLAGLDALAARSANVLSAKYGSSDEAKQVLRRREALEDTPGSRPSEVTNLVIGDDREAACKNGGERGVDGDIMRNTHSVHRTMIDTHAISLDACAEGTLVV